MGKKFGRYLYSLKESYVITYLLFFSLFDFIRVKKNKKLSQQFIERIMLAVTEVNGCEACSYAHTKMALESGMKNEEIKNMLAGINDDVPSDELPAIMFAQHYADFRGQPSKDSWERIVEIYGLSKAKGILGSIRIIMWGNAYGVAFTSFLNRFKRKADKRSSLLYEIGMITSILIYILLAVIHVLLLKLFKKPVIKF